LCIRWAQRFDALLVGLGIIDQPTICQPELVPIGASPYKEHRDEVRLVRARSRVEQFLERFVRRCTEAGVAHKQLVNVGVPFQEILLEAQRYDLIVLGQQTHFHFATQEHPDETLSRVLKTTPRPVVTVPAKLQDGSSVVIAYDGSVQAARAVQAFQALGLDASQPVHVVSVDTDHAAAARCADRAIEFLRFHDLLASTHAVVTAAPPAQVILEQARQLNAGLLVLGAYGQSVVREFFFGSVTRTLLKESPVPLLLYH
jgi:nucleotide-binding universal stress UspA family protein